MAYTTIKKPSDYFNTKLYTGNNNITQTISGVGFQPDWVWIKNRDNVEGHYLFDAVRGSGKILSSANTNAEADLAINTKPTIASDGFTLTSNGVADELNFGTRTYASWNWKANGAGVANTDGSISSTVSANTTSGFSIVKYTGTGSAGATVGHGLGVKPAMIIFKSLSVGGPSWVVYHQSKGATYTLYLNETSAGGTSAEMLNNTEPTSSLITLGNGTSSNSSGASTIAYCFAEKQGFSKFGSYIAGSDTTAKPNNDGTFIYTGFKPRFIMTKRTDGTSDWCIFDTVRSTLNPMYNILFPNKTDVENTSEPIDVYSNGWKPRADSGFFNYPAGSSWIYYAIAEQPLVGDNPATAR